MRIFLANYWRKGLLVMMCLFLFPVVLAVMLRWMFVVFDVITRPVFPTLNAT